MTENIRAGAPPDFSGASKRATVCLPIALSLAVALALPSAPAQAEGRSGKEVVEAICARCHATGLHGAPKIGDRAAWSKRASQGLSSLTLHAIEGIRKMPSHGGHPELSALELARAITYMVNQSGGNWTEPLSPSALPAERTGEQVVKAQCVKCHAKGVGGAPKIGDVKAWIPRLSQGLPYLVRSAIHGHGGMPPRGGKADLTDGEIRAAILYMYYPGGASAATSSSTATAAMETDPNHKTVAGLDIYLGYMPAERLRSLPSGSPERSMHGGVPAGPGYYHVNVSLFDETKQTPVDGARVELQLQEPGLTSVTTELDPMAAISAGSYGNYVKPRPGVRYVLTLRILRPGSGGTVEAKFEHKFE